MSSQVSSPMDVRPSSSLSNFSDLENTTTSASPASSPPTAVEQGSAGELDSAKTQYSKHPRFFFMNDTLQFTVENTDYSIHQCLLAIHAPTWLDELNQISGPIVLTDVRTSEVDALLSIIYPSDVRKRDIETVDEWSSVLRLATRWYFHSVRELAVEQLELIAPPSEKLMLARELNITKWLLPSFAALCLRDDPLSLAEAEQMTMADVVLIFTTRELIKDKRLPAHADIISQHIEHTLDPNSVYPRAVVKIKPQLETVPCLGPHPPPWNSSPVPPSLDQPSKAEDSEYDPATISEALREHQYDRAAVAMGMEYHEDVIDQINKWAHSGLGSRGESAVRDLTWAIIHRGAQEKKFIQPAVRILSDWKRDNATFRSTIDSVLQDAVYNGILPWVPDQADCNPSTASGKIIYSSQERWLDDNDFRSRCDNSLVFVTEVARAALLPLDAICDRLPDTAGSAYILYKYLVSLGPILDLPDLKDRLDRRIRACDDSVWGYGNQQDSAKRMKHRRWMQKIYRLREHNWVPEN